MEGVVRPLWRDAVIAALQAVPRLKRIGKQCLCRPDAGQPDVYPR